MASEEIERISRLNKELENHQKEMERFFQEKIKELRNTNELLSSSLREKDVLLKEIHHRVKNNLQLISSMIKLQSNYIKDKNTLNIYNETYNRVRSIGIIHEILYKSEDLSMISIPQYIRNLVTHLINSFGTNEGSVKLSINLENIFLDMDTTILCGLIINELVSNSLKHAFPEGRTGEICISFLEEDDKYTLKVSDNGIGMPEIFDYQSDETLGLKIVNTLAWQLKSLVEIERSSGTAFKITFKKPE